MAEQSRKRKAPEQLSPYSQEPTSSHEDEELEKAVQEPMKAFRKARARRTSASSPPALKGIFGNVSLAPESSADTLKSRMVAGLNKSLMKSISLVLEKQANKDLRFLFEQYRKYMKDIEENSD